jgi:hypothetical protein
MVVQLSFIEREVEESKEIGRMFTSILPDMIVAGQHLIENVNRRHM